MYNRNLFLNIAFVFLNLLLPSFISKYRHKYKHMRAYLMLMYMCSYILQERWRAFCMEV